MSVDVVDLEHFYAGPIGDVARRVVGRAVAESWGGRAPRSVLGLGFAGPYLDAAAVEASARRIAFMPAAQGVIGRTESSSLSAVLVAPDMLPLADGAVDRVLAVHVLETVADAREVLSEVWRVLDPGGRLLLVCPNRGGLWARLDTTPFGNGEPYSRSQLRRLLQDCWFEPRTWTEVLYVPPLRSRILLSGATAWERLGRRLRLPGAGLHVVDATKQLHRPIPVRGRQTAVRRMPVLVPVPATSRGTVDPAARVAAPVVGRTDDASSRQRNSRVL